MNPLGAPPAYQDTLNQNEKYQDFPNVNEALQTDNQGTLRFDYGGEGGNSSNNGELQSGNVLFPFDGLNVEDLWNWMLVTDAIEPTDDAEWMGTEVLEGGAEALKFK